MTEGIGANLETDLMRLLEAWDAKRYGKYPGFVVDNQDPDKRGRLLVTVPGVVDESDWALPCMPFGGLADHGWFMVPEVHAQVWVEFVAGDIDRPIWTGTFWQKDDTVPQEAAKAEPTTRILKTPGGNFLQFDDADGEEQIILRHTKEAELSMDKDGTVTVKDAQGNTLILDADAGEVLLEDTNGNSLALTSSGITLEDANGNTVELGSSGITIEGQQVVLKGSTVMLAGQGGEPVLKGTSFLTAFAAHTHPSAMGPTGPPIPGAESNSLSTKVMTS